MITVLWIAYGIMGVVVGGVVARMIVVHEVDRWNQDKPDPSDYVFGTVIGLVAGGLWAVVLAAGLISLIWFPHLRHDMVAAAKGTSLQAMDEERQKRAEEKEVRKELRRVRDEYLAERGTKLRKRKGRDVIPR